MKNNQQRGFTIIELLVSMAVFQVILMITLVGYMQISRFYQKSINTARLHQISNDIVNEVSRSIQNSGGMVAGDLSNNLNISGGAQSKTDAQSVVIPVNDIVLSGNSFHVICVDTARYLYRADVIEPGSDTALLTANPGLHAFIADTLPSASACSSATFPNSGNYRVILGKNMSVHSFGVSSTTASALYNVWINIAFTSDVNDLDLSNFALNGGVPTAGSYIACRGGSGSQYCAVSNVNTTVARRIGL